jgi:hypothetical protein
MEGSHSLGASHRAGVQQVWMVVVKGVCVCVRVCVCVCVCVCVFMDAGGGQQIQ